MSWVKKHYKIGLEVNVVNPRTGVPERAEIINHIQGSGFQARHTTGIIVRFESDGAIEHIEAAFLDESGGDLA